VVLRPTNPRTSYQLRRRFPNNESPSNLSSTSPPMDSPTFTPGTPLREGLDADWSASLARRTSYLSGPVLQRSFSLFLSLGHLAFSEMPPVYIAGASTLRWTIFPFPHLVLDPVFRVYIICTSPPLPPRPALGLATCNDLTTIVTPEDRRVT
jgi:hypothetical protein